MEEMTPDYPASAGATIWSLGDRYEVGPCIGRGGMAEVYEGRDTRLGRSVAVKILKPQHAGDRVVRLRLTSEAQAAARLSHPNVAAVYDVGDHEGLPYIVMELVRGGTLARRLRDGPMDQQEAVKLTTEVLAALDAAHRAGILHRDIKPGNILLTADGTAKVADFGIAKALEPDPDAVDLTGTSQVMGTPRYLAPELAAGEKASVSSDLWAVGAVLYEALTGRPPFDADTALAIALAAAQGRLVPPETYRPDLSPALCAVVTRALSVRPLDRYVSASEMAGALTGAETDPSPTLALDPPTAQYPKAAPVGRHAWLTRRYLLGGAAALLLLAILLAAALWPGGSHPTAAKNAAPPTSAPSTTLPTTTIPPTTEAPPTTTPPDTTSCAALRAQQRALQRQLPQNGKGDRSSVADQAASQIINSLLQGVVQQIHQSCD
jgi:serine/threonine-protein kinase